MADADPTDPIRRLDSLRHEVEDLVHRIDAAREEERRHEDRRINRRDTPDRRAAQRPETNQMWLV